MSDDECFCVYADYILFCLCYSEDLSFSLSLCEGRLSELKC